MNAKRSLAAVAAALSLTCMSAWAQGASMGVWNYMRGYQDKVYGTPDDGTGSGTLVTRFWVVGHSADQNSGSVPTLYQVMPYGQGRFFVWSDWGNGGVLGTMPLAADRTAFLYSLENGGKGQYIVMSVANGPLSFNFDEVTNGNSPDDPSVTVPLDIPKVSVSVFDDVTSGIDVGLTWDRIWNLKGFFDTAPPENVITGVAVRYRFSVGPPLSTRTGDWALAQDGFVRFDDYGYDPGGTLVRIPTPPPGVTTYLALSLLFDGAEPTSEGCAFAETAFVGEPVGVSGDTTDPQFMSVQAVQRGRQNVWVAWRMEQEADCLFYSMMGAPSPEGPWTLVGDYLPVDAGARGNYSMRVHAQGLGAVKVVAVTAREKFSSPAALVVHRR